jgi:hypothetical protein
MAGHDGLEGVASRQEQFLHQSGQRQLLTHRLAISWPIYARNRSIEWITRIHVKSSS